MKSYLPFKAISIQGCLPGKGLHGCLKFCFLALTDHYQELPSMISGTQQCYYPSSDQPGNSFRFGDDLTYDSARALYKALG